MRASLNDPTLAGYAGRFVWLELDFDNPANREFLARYDVTYTPSLFLLDARTERVAAKQLGGMTVHELQSFLERGENHDRDGEIAARTWQLANQRDWKPCAAIASAEAPHMRRGEMFARVVLAGLWAVNAGRGEAWVERAWTILAPLAADAVHQTAILRDHRFQLYQQMMVAYDRRGDRGAVSRWGERWLTAIDTIKPQNDDERSALDIARVDCASLMNQPARVIPALVESQRAMPANYNASLRLAQMEQEANRHNDAIADCDRGLAQSPGPAARSWLLRVKADSLLAVNQRAAARAALAEALKSAEAIASAQNREMNIEMIQKEITAMEQIR